MKSQSQNLWDCTWEESNSNYLDYQILVVENDLRNMIKGPKQKDLYLVIGKKSIGPKKKERRAIFEQKKRERRAVFVWIVNTNLKINQINVILV